MRGLFQAFHKLIKVYSDLSKNELDTIDLTPAQAKILLILVYNNNLIQRQLAEKAYVEPTTMSRVIDGMVEKGLVERIQHEESRRSYSIGITDLGKEKVTQAKECFLEVERKMFTDFTDEEKKVFYDLINKLSSQQED